MHSQFGLSLSLSNMLLLMAGLISAVRLGRQERAASLSYIASRNCNRTSRCWGFLCMWAKLRNAATGSSACLDQTKQQRWIAAANATVDVSNDAICTLETAAAGATLTSMARQSLNSSVSVAERDAWFGPRLAHLTTFLNDRP